MKIEIYRARGARFREVGFFDFEDEKTIANSGLLDPDAAVELAARLREVAHELATWAQERQPDQRQTILPIFDGLAA